MQPKWVTKETISVRTAPALKREFQRALKSHSDFSTITDFFESAMHALVIQTRRKEELVFPLEFVARPKKPGDNSESKE